jgi:hypothetical protein
MIAPDSKKAPAAYGGRTTNHSQTFYPSDAPQATHPANWLNPRRRCYAQRLLDYIIWHGRKLYLTPDQFADLRDYNRLDPWSVRQAVDDLYSLGVVDVRPAGEVDVVEALADDLDTGLLAPVVPPAAPPRIALAPARKESRP